MELMNLNALLPILCCPESHQSLTLADPDLLHSVNEAIRRGGVRSDDGELISEPLKEALVRNDRKFLYPIDDGIPLLVVGSRINLTELG